MRLGADFIIEESGRNITLTDPGIRHAEELLSCADLYQPANLAMLAALQNALHASDHFGTLPVFSKVQEMGAFYPELSVLSSLGFAVILIATAARQLVTTDY